MKKHSLYIFLSVLTGILLAFSFPNIIEKTLNVHTSFFMWFAFVPLLYIVISSDKISSVFIYSLLSTSIFYLSALYWICFVGPMGYGAYLAWFLFCVYLAMIYALSFVVIKYLNNKLNIDYIFSVPVILTIAEYIRGWLFTGWPGLTPAQSQHQLIPVLQILSITGVSGLNFIVFSINCIIVSIIAGSIYRYNKLENIVWIMIFIMLSGFAVISNYYQNTGTITVKTAIIQPNIDQNVRWTTKYQKYTMNTMKVLYKSISILKPNIVVWPETGYPGVLNMEGNKNPEIASWVKGAFSIVGSDKILIKNNITEYYNAAYMLNSNGKIIGDYSKHHLVPFGEYIPLQEVIPFVKKVVQRYGYVGFSSGSTIVPLDYKGIKIGPIICFDSFFPEISREHANKGAKILAHLSYETWYGVSPASAQVFTNVILRAVENRVYVVRSVASGISGIVNDKGEVLASTKLFEKKALVCELKLSDNQYRSFYTKHGDWLPLFLMIIFLFIMAARFIKI
ncbi:MAG: apolipoprotein N-acyltransferase [bacterium]